MQLVDYALVIVYLGLLLGLGFYKRLSKDSTAADMIVGGRMLTLPAFVASLVSTWYGGILGVGEFTYRFGVSNWLVQGVSYYLAAAIFAIVLAERARKTRLLTIPDRLAQVYDDRTAAVASIIIYFITVPAAFVLILGILGQELFGWPFWLGVVLGSLFSIVYVYMGGFASVVRTDLFQFILMFLGFAVMFALLTGKYGGLSFLKENLPDTHLTWHGGNTVWYIASWYVIALQTLVEPSFYQRCYAARSKGIARAGIMISIFCWAVFDFLTTSCGLYARALLPDLTNPLSSFPALAVKVLPAGLLGLFVLALLATVMSTVDSYSFLAASTFGNDIMRRFGLIGEDQITRYTRIGLILSSVLAVVVALFFRSVVEIWYVFYSVGTPALLVPVFFSFVGKRRLPSKWALRTILLSGAGSLIWYLSQYWSDTGTYWFSLAPVFPGLCISIIIFLRYAKTAPAALPRGS
jgi:SSS family solute:Na+ symporter